MTNIFLHDSRFLSDLLDPNSIHAVVTDPPYGMNILGNDWDKCLPPQEVWESCFEVMRPGGFLVALGHTRLYHHLACNIESSGFIIKDCLCWMYAVGFPRSYNIKNRLSKREDISDEDKNRMEGTGTVLKTAWEPIVLAQKPLDGSIIDNFLKWKTGVLNIDECRIPYESELDKKSLESFINFEGREHGSEEYFSINKGGKKQVNIHPDGRWPSNVLWLDPFHAEYNKFFLVPKPSKKEKRSYNTHETVKPVDLMSHLIKLVTLNPVTSGICGTVLDPFVGSGTTGIACKSTGRNFIGVDNNSQSVEIAKQRISHKCLLDIF